RSASVQFFVALRVWIFLHFVRRLFLLDDCPLRDRRGMDGGCSPSAREHRCAGRGAGDLLHPDLPAPAPSLRMDEHSAGERSEPRFQARLLESEFLCSTGRILPRLFYYCLVVADTFFS